MKQNEHLNRRILIIDDNQNIHSDFREVLMGKGNRAVDLAETASEIFGTALESSDPELFEIDSALQGREGVEMVRSAADEGRPYALAFVDLKMPPGWDGIETIQRLWQACPDLQVVVCTAHFECQWRDIIEALGPTNKLLVLKKPYDNVEVVQMARVLTEKWILTRQASLKTEQLEQMVKERTNELTRANEPLKEEIVERQKAGLR